MKTRTIALMFCMAAAAAGAEQKVTVCVRNTAAVPGPDLVVAETSARKMFAGIGVTLEFRNRKCGSDPLESPILVELATATPGNFLPGALAYALPFEGSHLTIFYDRIETNRLRGPVLARVLVHEITHLLQGIKRHSETGVMKATWTRADFDAMRQGNLPFTAHDVDLNHAGLASRTTATEAAALPATR